MKRLFTLMVALFATLSVVLAQTTSAYTGKLSIEAIGQEESMEPVTVFYDDNGGKSDQIRITNLTVSIMDSEFAVGNITVINVQNTNGNLMSSPKGKENNIVLTDGDDPDVEWLGSSIGGVQGDVSGTISGENIKLTIPLNVKIGPIPVTLNILFEGVLTDSGIHGVVADSTTVNVYNIEGKHVDATAKGIVIVKGKKYINK